MFVAVPLNGETWLICGGRKFWDEVMFESAIGDLMQLRGCPSKLVHGDAPGADTMAKHWGKRMSIEVVAVPRKKNEPGNIRNGRMLKEHPDISFVVAFPGQTGTADMVRRAREKKITVAEIKSERPPPVS